MDIDNELVGKTVTKADVNGFSIELTFSDGSVFIYGARDKEYSSWNFIKDGVTYSSYLLQ